MSGRRERGARSKAVVEREGRHIAPGYQGLAQYAGLAMARGSGCTLIDEDGNEYLDFMAGIAVGSVGHCHPDYVDALKRQVERLHFGSFTTETRAKFLELLASVTPEGLTRIQLFSGGAEAVEAALRLAKLATKRHEVLGFWGGFHGKTGGVLGLLGSDFKHHLGPFVPGQHLTPSRIAIGVRSSSPIPTAGSPAPTTSATSSSTRPGARSPRSWWSRSRGRPATWSRRRDSSARCRPSRASTARCCCSTR